LFKKIRNFRKIKNNALTKKSNYQKILKARAEKKRLIRSEITEDFRKKTMQTLTAGSFLNLENASTVEALKNTARRLAEHSANVIKENLPPAALESLADSLWGKAEYVTRETERRRLQQIFNENFRERFRELKPEATEAHNSEAEFSPVNSTIENAESKEELKAPAIVERETSEIATASENVSSIVSPESSATVAEGKRDEFLGFVASGESFGEEQTAETGAALTATEESPQKIVQADDEPAVETSPMEIRVAVAETPDSENQVAETGDSKESATAENSDHAKTEPPAAADAASAENKPTTAAAATTASASKNVAGAKEPFEFEKCTVNLNLTLLPAESGSNKRKLIVGAMSHDLPPEIDFLEINEGSDLTQIAALVSEKLARFKQTLPVKYIEQLRESKNKSAKKSAVAAKTTVSAAAAIQPANAQAKNEKTSGGQKMQAASNARTEKPQSEAVMTEKREAATQVAPNRAVNPTVTMNSIQGSLF
jgi:hypothetical protein